MINSDLNTGGIHRALLLSVGGEIKIYVPGLTSLNPNSGSLTNDAGGVNKESYETNKNSLLTPIWCLPNIEAKQHDEVHPCWVTFENGDAKRAIIMGFLGKGIKYHANGSGGSVNGSSGSENISGNNTTGGTYSGEGTTGIDNADYVFKVLISKGASIAGACGVLANLEAENGFSTKLNSGDGGKASGIAQWHPDRWSNCVDYCNKNNLDSTTITGQTAFLIYEIQTGYKDLWNLICNANGEQGAYDVGYKMCYDFERPANKAQKSVDRGNLAKTKYWPIFKDGKIENNQYAQNVSISSTGYAWPVPGHNIISSPYGKRGSGFHYGIDIAGTNILGANIVATKSGVVKTNAWNEGGYGWWVAIEHDNGVFSRYGHMKQQSNIRVGTKVNQGDTIGYVGSTGRSTGPHLHFEIRPNNSPVDPLNYVTKP